MHKVLAKALIVVAFLGMSLTGTALQGVSIQGHELLGPANTTYAYMKPDPDGPRCYPTDFYGTTWKCDPVAP